jgi:hypothetical protein
MWAEVYVDAQKAATSLDAATISCQLKQQADTTVNEPHCYSLDQHERHCTQQQENYTAAQPCTAQQHTASFVSQALDKTKPKSTAAHSRPQVALTSSLCCSPELRLSQTTLTSHRQDSTPAAPSFRSVLSFLTSQVAQTSTYHACITHSRPKHGNSINGVLTTTADMCWEHA